MKYLLVLIVLLLTWFNFPKILSLTSIWMLYNDGYGYTFLTNNLDEKIKFLVFPESSDLEWYYNDLYFVNGAGFVNIDKKKSLSFNYAHTNTVLAKTHSNYLSLDLNYDYDREEVQLSQFTSHKEKKEFEDKIIDIAKGFRDKLILSIFMLGIATLALFMWFKTNQKRSLVNYLLILIPLICLYFIHLFYLFFEIRYFYIIQTI